MSYLRFLTYSRETCCFENGHNECRHIRKVFRRLRADVYLDDLPHTAFVMHVNDYFPLTPFPYMPNSLTPCLDLR